jgi:hypothetical protein
MMQDKRELGVSNKGPCVAWKQKHNGPVFRNEQRSKKCPVVKSAESDTCPVSTSPALRKMKVVDE